MSVFDFSGKKALVTGANRGMGFSVAKKFYEAGADVVLLDITEHVVESAASIDPSGERTHGVVGDISKLDEIETVFNECLEKLGGEIDILINCAGISRRGVCEDYPLSDWEAVMNVNASGLFFMCKLAGKEMLKKGSGKIINFASMLSFFGSGSSIAYSASKGAVAQITKSLCIAWGAKGLNVNAVAPGWVETELTGPLRQNKEKTAGISKRIPMVRWADPDTDIAGPVLFLASDQAKYINGAVIPIDGGYAAF
ncbi:MAG: SDR family NAD(P)-dependent oxidoreductase [Pleomorphochaeta sp.]